MGHVARGTGAEKKICLPAQSARRNKSACSHTIVYAFATVHLVTDFC